MPVQTTQRDLIEVDQSDACDTGAGQSGAGVRADAAAADNDDKGAAQGGEPCIAQEDAVARELLEDELVVEVAVLCAVRERLVVLVFFVGFGERADAGYLVGVGVRRGWIKEGARWGGLLIGALARYRQVGGWILLSGTLGRLVGGAGS